MDGTERPAAHEPRAANEPHPTEAEDAALALALVIVGILSLTLVTLLVLEFFEFLPNGVQLIAWLSLLVFLVMIGRAIVSRALSTPIIYGGHTPILRHLNR